MTDPIEQDPFFIASQWRESHVLTEEDLTKIEQMYQEWTNEVEDGSQAFDNGYKTALRDIGGEELVQRHKEMSAARIAKFKRMALQKLEERRIAEDALARKE